MPIDKQERRVEWMCVPQEGTGNANLTTLLWHWTSASMIGRSESFQYFYFTFLVTRNLYSFVSVNCLSAFFFFVSLTH